MFSGLTLAILLSAQMPTAKADQPSKREQMRYDRRTFEEWRDDLQTELKLKRRLEALRAMQIFAAHGYASEASEAALSVLAVCEREQHFGDEDASLICAIEEVLITAGNSAQPALVAALRGNSAKQKRFTLNYLDGKELIFALKDIRKTVLDKDEAVSVAAVEMLACNLEKKGVMDVLGSALRDGNMEQRKRIVEHLSFVNFGNLGL